LTIFDVVDFVGCGLPKAIVLLKIIIAIVDDISLLGEGF